MAEHHITCEDCHGPYTASRSDARRCPSCRLLRILTYTAARCGHRACRACGEQYAPFRRNDRLCAACEPQKHDIPVVTCIICKRDAPRFERLTVCCGCVKGTETQPLVIRALQKGQESRKSTNPQPKGTHA